MSNLTALDDVSVSSSKKAWRCYSTKCVAEDGRYIQGCKGYCTRPQLAEIVNQCEHPMGEMKLHLLTDPSALCLDGSPGAFYFAPGSDATKWMLWHEGKAWCLSHEDCIQRALSKDGRGGWFSSGWPKKPGCLPESIPFAAGDTCPGQQTCQLSPDPAVNPAFNSFNMVFIKTCDGGSFSGNRSAPVNTSGVATRTNMGSSPPLYYRGRSILDSVIDALLGMGVGNATDVVIGGGSAGALAVYLHADHYRARLDPLHEKKFVALADCGFFMDSNGVTTQQLGEEIGLPHSGGYHDGIAWIYSADGMNAVVDRECRAAHAANPELCLFAAHLSPFVKTPLFALQAKYDAWQIPNILRSADSKVINAFGANLTALLNSSLLSGRPGNGAFVDGCKHHCGGYNTYHVDNMTQAEAVAAWYINGSASLPKAGSIIDLRSCPCVACCK
jgi:hypothetical protein